MKKKKGFTLIELLVAMTLLVFVIVVSSSLFDYAIQGIPRLRQTISDNSKNTSDIEGGMLDVRKAYVYYKVEPKVPSDKPPNYDLIIGQSPTGAVQTGAPVKINIEGGIRIEPPSGGAINISTVEGYFVSVDSADSKKIKYNDAKADDKIFTFVSAGYIPSVTSSIEKIYFNETQRFHYLPFNSTTSTVINSEYKVASANKANLQLARLRFLRSPISSNRKIYSTYTDSVLAKTFANSLTNDIFEYIGEESSSKNKDGDSANYKIGTYTGDANKKKAFLDSIDRSYASSAITFNINGHSGAEITSFNNEEKSKQNIIHIIGLPKTDNLVAHYDHNLVMSKSKTSSNIYYSLFDISSKDFTAYGNNLTNASNDYVFDWDNKDIRDFLGIGQKIGNIQMPNGFLKSERKSNAEGLDIEITNYNKYYGDTLYYRMSDVNNSIRIQENGDFTFFVKFNPINYNEQFNNSTQRHPYTLLSYNFDYDTGDMIPSSISNDKGFIVYVDSAGFINILERKSNGEISFRNTGINIGKLYKDGSNFKFDTLSLSSGNINGRRDEREGFNILSVSKKANNLKLYLLTEDGSSKNLKTSMKEIVSIEVPNTSGQYTFGNIVKNLKKTRDAAELENNYDIDPVMEISDVVMYLEGLSDNDRGMIMDYLYRKYLTKSERDNFDSYFVSKY